MSLIDDALKRAQAARQDEPGKTANRPWIPTPMPDAGLARRRRLFRWLGLVLMVGIVVTTGAWLFRREVPRSLPLPAGEGRGEGSAPLAASRPTAVPTVPLAPTQPSARPRPTRLPSSAGETPGEGPSPAAAPSAPARPPQALADGRTYAGSVTLAGGGRIELGGIVWSETEPRALLNDRISAVGAYVEGFTVAAIEADRVALERDGLTIYLSVK